MTEPTAQNRLKRAIPPDLQRKVEDIQTKQLRYAGIQHICSLKN